MRTSQLRYDWSDMQAAAPAAGGAAAYEPDQPPALPQERTPAEPLASSEPSRSSSEDAPGTAFYTTGTPAESKRTRLAARAPIIWGTLGFMTGMLAWHFVGFWSFVSDVVLNRNAAAQTTPGRHYERLAAGTPPPVSSFVTDAKHCVALAIDPGTGETQRKECPMETVPMRDAGRHKRADRIASGAAHNAWLSATAIEPEAAPENSPADSGAIEVHTAGP